MEYIAVSFQFTFAEDFASDIFVAELAEIGFDSFENTDNGIMAYVPATLFNQKQLEHLTREFPYKGVTLLEVITIEDKNWNEEWEKHFFNPIVIDDMCVIHSSFHTNYPTCKYNIVIDPKMAFGTGHHETTSLIISQLLQVDLQGKSLLDMGCGTSVLAILAAMRGAAPITAIDIDSWCTENSIENLKANQIQNVEVLLGDASLLEERHFDVIIANINRNILLADMRHYAACLSIGGELFLSGFYTEDIQYIEAEAIRLGFVLTNCTEKNNWAVLRLKKTS